MAGGKEHAGVHGSVATGRGSRNQGHRESEWVKGTSDMPIRRPKDTADVGVAMASGESTRPHVIRALEAMKQEINCTGRERGARRSSPR